MRAPMGGGLTVVAHPPCRGWGRLRHIAKPDPGETELALFALDQVRQCGGVLEHPAGSALWKQMELPLEPGSTDRWGGYTLRVNQCWWGHRARKSTWLYIVGCRRRSLPVLPPPVGRFTHTIGTGGHQSVYNPRALPGLPKAEREHSPPAFAAWLVELALRC